MSAVDAAFRERRPCAQSPSGVRRELLHIVRRNPGAALVTAWAGTSLTGCVGIRPRSSAHPDGAPVHRALMCAAVGHAGLRHSVMAGSVSRGSLRKRRTAHERQCCRNKKLLHGYLR
jgi:hypothetical protein